MPLKFYLHKILLHIPVTFSGAGGCTLHIIHVYFNFIPDQASKSTCALYTSMHYNRNIAADL